MKKRTARGFGLAAGALPAFDFGVADFTRLDQRIHAGLGQLMAVPVHAAAQGRGPSPYSPQ